MSNFLRINLKKREFFVERGRLMFRSREGIEGYLMVEYRVTVQRARMIIEQGAVQGEINLAVVIERKERNGQTQ